MVSIDLLTYVVDLAYGIEDFTNGIWLVMSNNTVD